MKRRIYIFTKFILVKYETALHIACEKNYLEIVELLLKQPNIDINMMKEITIFI